MEYTEDRKIALFDHMAKEPFHLPVKPEASDGMEVYAVDLLGGAVSYMYCPV